MSDPKLVNIGTEREPVFVPADAISGDPNREEKYWRGVATGSVLPSSKSTTDERALDLLLKTKK